MDAKVLKGLLDAAREIFREEPAPRRADVPQRRPIGPPLAGRKPGCGGCVGAKVPPVRSPRR